MDQRSTGGGFPARLLAVCGIASSILAAEVTAKTFDEAKQQMDAHIVSCTERTGHDPDRLDDIGENALGPSERRFLDCVYEGVERLIIPESSTPEAYRSLVQEHRRMTDAIEQGQMTRSERQARTDTMVDEIKRQDEASQRQQRAELEAAVALSEKRLKQHESRERRDDLHSDMMREALRIRPPSLRP
jgi:hypothetical protein